MAEQKTSANSEFSCKDQTDLRGGACFLGGTGFECVSFFRF